LPPTSILNQVFLTKKDVVNYLKIMGKSGFLMNDRNAHSGHIPRSRVGTGVNSIDLYRSMRCRKGSRYDIEQRRLSRTVMADQPHYLAGHDRQRHIAQCTGRTKVDSNTG